MCRKQSLSKKWFNYNEVRTLKIINNSANYIPDKPIKLLIIGESPPYSGDYFYVPKKNCHHNSMPAKIFKSLYPNKSYNTKSDYNDFKNDSFFLMDLFEFPIDILTHKVRSELIILSFVSFFKRFKRLKLNSNCYIIVVLPQKTSNILLHDINFKQKIQNCNIKNAQKLKIATWKSLESELICLRNSVLCA
jgi:hypothetical protein